MASLRELPVFVYRDAAIEESVHCIKLNSLRKRVVVKYLPLNRGQFTSVVLIYPGCELDFKPDSKVILIPKEVDTPAVDGNMPTNEKSILTVMQASIT
jgi:hypothetical protein